MIRTYPKQILAPRLEDEVYGNDGIEKLVHSGLFGLSSCTLMRRS